MTTRTSGKLAVPSLRIPVPVLTPTPTGWELTCKTCPVRISGLPEQGARRWADGHQCPDDPRFRLENHAWNSQTRGDNGGLFRA